MKKWNFDELRSLCRQKGMSDSNIKRISVYTTSLDWRHQRAYFHAKKAIGIWKGLLKSSFSIPSERYLKAAFKYEAYVEACVQSVHSQGDILAQILNLVILVGHYEEEEVSLKKIMESNMPPPVRNELEALKGSCAFRYVDAFCNTIKHRRLIRSTFRAEYGEQQRNEEGLVFIPFQYKGIPYDQTWGSDILTTYRKAIFRQINQIGFAINASLKP